MKHGFWLMFTVVTILWYGIVTLIVVFKGSKDIREMLEQLGGRKVGKTALRERKKQ